MSEETLFQNLSMFYPIACKNVLAAVLSSTSICVGLVSL